MGPSAISFQSHYLEIFDFLTVTSIRKILYKTITNGVLSLYYRFLARVVKHAKYNMLILSFETLSFAFKFLFYLFP